MSFFVIVVEEYADKIEVLKALRRLTGQAISQIQDNLAAKRPVYRRELYGLDHDEAAEQLLSVIAALQELDTVFRLHDVGEGDKLSRINEITPEILKNLLEAFEEEREVYF